jgi:predicted permease
MIDFLLSPPNLITVFVVVVVTPIISFIAMWTSEEDSGWAYPLWILSFLGLVYLLWHGGAWLVARFMDTVHSYR